MNECTEYPFLGERLQIGTGFTEIHTFTNYLTDLKPLVDQMADSHVFGRDIPSVIGGLERDVGITLNKSESFNFEQC